MGFSFGKIGKWTLRGISLLPAVIQAMVAIEQLKTTEPGPAKREAAIDMAMTFWLVAEGVTDKDLRNDADVRAGVGAVIDAIAAVQKVITQKSGG